MHSASEAITQGHQLLQAGQLAEAERLFRQAVALEPANPRAQTYLGVVLHQQSRLREAADAFRDVVRLLPDDAQARANLGRVQFDLGQFDEAEINFRRGVLISPQNYRSHVNLGSVLSAAGKWDEAATSYRTAVELKTDDAGAHLGLAAALGQLRQPEQAEHHFRRAIDLQPRWAAAHNNLGVLYQAQGRLAEAVAAFRQAVALEPNSLPARNSLAAVLGQQNKAEEAMAAFHEALSLDPNSAEVHNNLGLFLKSQGRLQAAIDCFRRGLAAVPHDADLHNHLAGVLGEVGQIDEAAEHSQRAISLNPSSAGAHNNFASLLQAMGHVDQAVSHFRRATELDPSDAQSHSNFLYALNFHPGWPAEAIFAEHRRWAERHADPLTVAAAPYDNDRTRDRRLVVGYVSPYFRGHAVNSFSEPILAAHDHARCEIVCFSDVVAADATTARLRGCADRWFDVAGLSDNELAELVRRERIDILIDLTGHIAGGKRLLTFARKPAPVQVTYIGYQNTTGMRAMDYRLTDEYSDPVGTTDPFYTEHLVRLPRSFFTYLAPHEAPPVTPLPASQAGFVTFGSFNNFAKITPEVLATWARILSAVPRSRLLLLAHRTPALEQYVRGTFEQQGVAADRVELVPRGPYAQYLGTLGRADIALDPFPFNGHTTVCDSLWMGVPPVMLAGATYASRFGSSALANLGLLDLVAKSPQEYVEVAARLAMDLQRLQSLRANLRALMEGSALLDARGFTHNLEDVYRAMWNHWCDAAG